MSAIRLGPLVTFIKGTELLYIQLQGDHPLAIRGAARSLGARSYIVHAGKDFARDLPRWAIWVVDVPGLHSPELVKTMTSKTIDAPVMWVLAFLSGRGGG